LAVEYTVGGAGSGSGTRQLLKSQVVVDLSVRDHLTQLALTALTVMEHEAYLALARAVYGSAGEPCACVVLAV
jgi:uncharacterized protein YkvS